MGDDRFEWEVDDSGKLLWLVLGAGLVLVVLSLTPVVPAATVSVPDTTLKVACTAELPASTSAIDSPVPCSVRLVCSVAL